MNFDKALNILVAMLLTLAIAVLAAVMLHPICSMFPF